MSIYYNHLKKVFNKVKENRYVILAWIICYIIMLATEWIYRNEKWVYDAYNYWTRGSLLKEGQFWLGSIDGFRGYIFPLFLGVINSMGGYSYGISLMLYLLLRLSRYFCRKYI